MADEARVICACTALTGLCPRPEPVRNGGPGGGTSVVRLVADNLGEGMAELLAEEIVL